MEKHTGILYWFENWETRFSFKSFSELVIRTLVNHLTSADSISALKIKIYVYLLIHQTSFSKYLLKTHYVPTIVLDTENATVSMCLTFLCICTADGEKTINQQVNKKKNEK